MQRPAHLVLWTAASLCLLATSSRGDEEERRPDKATEEFVARWAEKAAALKTVDVRFRREDSSPAWGTEQFEGRLCLKAPNLTFLELTAISEDGKATPFERLVWTESDVRQYREDMRQESILVNLQKRRQVPELAALPFLFGLNAKDVLKKYDVKLKRETPESFLVELQPQERATKQSVSKCFIELDRKTFLPRRYVLISPNGKDVKDYRALETRVNEAICPEIFEPETPEGWNVLRSDTVDERWLRLWGLLDLQVETPE